MVASGIVSVFKSIWHDSWGPRLEYILYASVAALLDCENVSLLGVQRMLSDGRYRAWVVKQVKDPMVRSFWENEFEHYDKKFMLEAIAPIQNKVGQLLMSPHVRNILGQVKSRIDARFMMDNGRIFIADVSKGKLGADKSNLLGALLVTQFQLAAMSRSDVPEHERKDFFLYVDEFQSFASDSFISILSEARKYRLCLTLSHQYVDQVRPEIRDAVFGNVGSIVAFRVGHRDAKQLELAFGETYRASELSSLGNHEVCAKLLADGQDPTTGGLLMSTWIDFKELRAKLSFEQVLRHYNVEVKARGTQHHGYCPLPNHNGKKNSPSFSANLDKGIFQCFGCGAKGNLLEFAALMENTDPKDGAAFLKVAGELQKKFCPELGDVRSKSDKPASQKKAEPKDERPVLVNQPLDFELQGLDEKHPYLFGRGFTPETIRHFGLGYPSVGELVFA